MASLNKSAEKQPPTSLIAVRGSAGVALLHGSANSSEYDNFERDTSKLCKAMTWSKDGTRFALYNGQRVKVFSLPTGKVILDLERPRARCLEFSPKGSLLSVYEAYTVNRDPAQGNVGGVSNVHIFDVETGNILKSCVQKSQTDWNFQWKDDESLCGQIFNSDVHFFENNKFDSFHCKTKGLKVTSFSISRGTTHIACFIHGSKGQPSFVRLFKYPVFEGNNSIISSKSFFKDDKVDFKWNLKGNALLFLTSTQVDKTGASYYGENMLHLMLTNGDSSFVQPPKAGPIYCFEWNPDGTEFCVVHGFMPAQATLFNLKGDPTFDFGTGPRNAVFYNAHGNMLTLAGFGNLRGNMEVWDLKQKKEITKMQASDTTYLEWSPDCQHILTAVTSPRLRVNNGYKLWHYSGSLIYEKLLPENEELWEAVWQPFPRGSFSEAKISYKPVQGIAPAKPEASKEVYRPPGARGMPAAFQSHEYFQPKSDKSNDASQKKSGKNKKRMDKKTKKNKNETVKNTEESPSNDEVSNVISNEESNPANSENDKNKKIKNLKLKLRQIEKLKETQTAGGKLNSNQIEKIKKEELILNELKALEI